MLISIIIPVYNAAPYIENCLQSIMNQTYKGDMECLLIDDCGNDDSMAVAERVINEYNGAIRFKMLHHERNSGPSAARNTGTAAAEGDYICYVDADDELPVDSIEKLVRPILEDELIEMVTGNDYRIWPSKPPVKWRNYLEEKKIVSNKAVRDQYFVRYKFPLGPWNKLIKRSFLQDNNITFKEGIIYEDWLWRHHLLKHMNRIYMIPDFTYKYLKHENTITTGTPKKKRAYHFGVVFHEIATNFTPGEEAREAKAYLSPFSKLSIGDTDMEMFQETCRLFKQALSDGHHKREVLFLSVIMSLSKYSWGRKLLSAAIHAKKSIK